MTDYMRQLVHSDTLMTPTMRTHLLALANRCLSWRVGSQMYGLATETSDVDMMHLYWAPEDSVRPFPGHPDVLHDEGNGAPMEHKLYSLHKFSEMLTKGNPNSVELCWYPPDSHDHFGPGEAIPHALYSFLYDVRPHVLTQRCLKQYLGHMTGILQELTRSENAPDRYPAPTPKRISHALRLGYTVQGIMETGTMYKLADHPEHLERVRKFKFNHWQDESFGFVAVRHMYNELDTMFKDVKDRFPADSEDIKVFANARILEMTENYFQLQQTY